MNCREHYLVCQNSDLSSRFRSIVSCKVHAVAMVKIWGCFWLMPLEMKIKSYLWCTELKPPFLATKCDKWISASHAQNKFVRNFDTIRISNILTSHHLRIIIPSSFMVPPSHAVLWGNNASADFATSSAAIDTDVAEVVAPGQKNQLFWLVVYHSLYHISTLEIIHFYPEREWLALATHTLKQSVFGVSKGKHNFTKENWKKNLLSVLSPSVIYSGCFLQHQKGDDPEM